MPGLLWARCFLKPELDLKMCFTEYEGGSSQQYCTLCVYRNTREHITYPTYPEKWFTFCVSLDKVFPASGQLINRCRGLVRESPNSFRSLSLFTSRDTHAFIQELFYKWFTLQHCHGLLFMVYLVLSASQNPQKKTSQKNFRQLISRQLLGVSISRPLVWTLKGNNFLLSGYFSNIPATMFTAFRCFNGECVPWAEKTNVDEEWHRSCMWLES